MRVCIVAVYLLLFICASAVNERVIVARFIRPHNEVCVNG